jgi:small acid-soluble spore protein H (minor)
MDIKRAQEILNSKGIIDVKYQGESVWINNIDMKREVVDIEGINNKLINLTVNVNDLNEFIM